MDADTGYAFSFEPDISVARFYAASRSLATNGMHVEVENQNRKHGFLRLRPAV